ncbi:MAG: hypothetical protein U5J64_02435 [Halobacteriales archaeon]|nr:hypothetical protein [Halobacteriales archaeon]
MTQKRKRRVLFTVVGLLILLLLMTGILTTIESSVDVGFASTFGAVVGLDDVNGTGADQVDENLTAVPYPGSGGGGQYADVENGELSLNLTRINPSSETEIPRIFTISYEGDEKVEVWVEAVNQESYPGEVWFYSTEPEYVRFDEDKITLEDGEEADIGVYVSSFNATADDVLLEYMRIHAEPVGGEGGEIDTTVGEYGDTY